MLQEKRLYHISMVWYNTYGFISTYKVDRRLLNGNRKQYDEKRISMELGKRNGNDTIENWLLICA